MHNILEWFINYRNLYSIKYILNIISNVIII
jgi:hypothetical protein